MIALDRGKFCLLFGMFLFGLRARITSIQAWNFQRACSASMVNARSRYYETTTKTDVSTNMNSPITCQILSSPSRRQVFSLIPPTLAVSASLVLACPIAPALASNMPVSNGADTTKVGTVSVLLPIVKLRTDLESLRQTLEEQHKNNVDAPLSAISKTKTAIYFTKSEGSSKKSATISTLETDFKRLFDSYSEQVSYKQKFLDQNAFLVYYTKGYDGPGRESMEKDPVNERQTLQFGARNEAWICWDDFLAEWEYYSSLSRRTGKNDDVEDSFLDLIKYLSNTIQAVDRYLRLSPPQDLESVQQGSER
jgi:hypothetical protein